MEKSLLKFTEMDFVDRDQDPATPAAAAHIANVKASKLISLLEKARTLFEGQIHAGPTEEISPWFIEEAEKWIKEAEHAT